MKLPAKQSRLIFPFGFMKLPNTISGLFPRDLDWEIFDGWLGWLEAELLVPSSGELYEVRVVFALISLMPIDTGNRSNDDSDMASALESE